MEGTRGRISRLLMFCVATAIGTAVLARAAIANGYCLVDYDSGAYLAMSVQLWPHVERTIPYPLFLTITGLQRTLVAPVVVQAVILFVLLYAALRWVSGLTFVKALGAALAAAALLSLFTGASYTISWLLPDAFSAVFILAIAVIAAARNVSKWRLTCLAALAMAAASMHMSHLLIGLFFAVVSVLLLVLSHVSKASWTPPSKLLRLICLIGLGGWAVLLGSNLATTRRPFLLKGSNVYLCGKLAENGILKSFLNEHPHGYALAAHRDRLPMDSVEFLWRKSGPIAQMGGWGRSRAECDRVAWAILTKPKYLLRFAALGLRDGAKLLWHFDVYRYPSYVDRPEVLPPLAKYYPREIDRFLAADQQKGKLASKAGTNPFARINAAQRALAVAAIIVLAAVLTSSTARKAVGPQPLIFSLVLLLGVVVNALVCGSLSAIDARYQSRVIWLLPLTTMIMAAGWWDNRSRQLNERNEVARPLSAPPTRQARTI